MSQVRGVQSQFIEADPRYLMQGAKLAISDIYDAITELGTNADDRYQILVIPGRIEIEVERRRSSRSILKIRDFADGMTSDAMKKKLSRMGTRVSGLEMGKDVRGTNSRGAKDVAALGDVTFQSIASDGKFHECSISEYFKFVLNPPSEVTSETRQLIGILVGTGTVVTINLRQDVSVPQHENMCDRLANLVPLRDILSSPQRKVIVIDKNRQRSTQIAAPTIVGTERLAETFSIPGYPGITAKLTIKRAAQSFERVAPKFRLGGILVKSKHAVHEATLFDAALENDIHAQKFFGRLTCAAIDELWNDYDERFAKEEPFAPSNPKPVIDPSRRTGLTKDHPFVEALQGEVLKRLRPLVEEERRQAEQTRARIENKETRRRLNELERKASEFLRDYAAEDETATGSNQKSPSLRLKQRGYSLTPPYAQMVVGESIYFTLQVSQEQFPEFGRGAGVSVECLSPCIEAESRVCFLESHPTRAETLSARFKVTALLPTPTTGIRVRAGRVLDETAIEVLASAAEKYSHVADLQFERRRYSGTCGTRRKKIRILAPLSLCSEPTEIQLSSLSPKFVVPARATLVPDAQLKVTVAEITLKLPDDEATTTLTAAMAGSQVTAELRAFQSAGDAISIKLEDIDYGAQRYRKKNNVIEIATRHPSLKRYLGNKPDFVGQDAQHFRVLLAEIVADAVCSEIVSRNGELQPENYANADWDQYYAEWSALMTKFLPVAHKTQLDI